MKKILISQIDERWHKDSRYDRRSVDALGNLDEKIMQILDNPTTQNKEAAMTALAAFNSAVESLIKRGTLRRSYRTYSIFGYGCLDCCLCMVVSDFKQPLFEHNSRNGLPPTPKNFLKVLRSWQILSVVGYQYEMILDLVSVMTNSRVQLTLHEDYGVAGVRLVDSPLLKFALRYRESITLVACVKDHAIFGKKPVTHWVVLDPLGSSIRDGFMMRDPAKLSIKRFSYSKLYTLCLYTTPELGSRLLALHSSSI